MRACVFRLGQLLDATLPHAEVQSEAADGLRYLRRQAFRVGPASGVASIWSRFALEVGQVGQKRSSSFVAVDWLDN